MSRFDLDPYCEICGDRKGGGTDHSECSRIKQDEYMATRRRPCIKKMTRKQSEWFGRYASRNYQ